MEAARLPFGFARRHGVLVAGEQDGVARLLVKPGVAAVALAEAASAQSAAERIIGRYNDQTGRLGTAFVCAVADGARTVPA